MLNRFCIVTRDAAYQVDLRLRIATVLAKDPHSQAVLSDIKGEVQSRISIGKTFFFFEPKAREGVIESGDICSMFLDSKKAFNVCHHYPKHAWDLLWELETREVVEKLKEDNRCLLSASDIPAEYFDSM